MKYVIAGHENAFRHYVEKQMNYKHQPEHYKHLTHIEQVLGLRSIEVVLC